MTQTGIKEKSILGETAKTASLQQKVKEAVTNSSSELFYIEEVTPSLSDGHSTIYKSKEAAIKHLERFFNSDKTEEELESIHVYEMLEYNIFNHVNSNQGHTNLSIIKKMHENSSIRLNLKDCGYVFYREGHKPNRVVAVADLIEGILVKKEDGGNGFLYPTVGKLEDGTLKLVQDIQVYRVTAKLS